MRSLQGIYSAIFDHGDGSTVFRLRKAVLCVMLLMVVATPLLQLNSLDQFPVVTDDIETQAIYCILSLGMLLVVALVLMLIPVLTLWRLFVPPVSERSWRFLAAQSTAEHESPPLFEVPLRV